jgi:hypothetical protein
MKRAVSLAAALVLAMLWMAVPAQAGPEPAGDCTTSSGVIVAVDFGPWGGPVLRSCGSTPTTAYAALNQGGWHTAGTQHDGPGFICRIGYAGYAGGTEYPTPSQQACVLTPPATAYWSFWYANPGAGGWTYSQTGAMSTRPVPGSVELWVFGGSAVPAITPGSLRATNVSPAGSVKEKTALPRDTTTPARATAPARAAAKTPAPARPAPTALRTTILDAPPAAASAPASHGSATPAIIALVIVLALTAAGITAVLRRPRRGQ